MAWNGDSMEQRQVVWNGDMPYEVETGDMEWRQVVWNSVSMSTDTNSNFKALDSLYYGICLEINAQSFQVKLHNVM